MEMFNLQEFSLDDYEENQKIVIYGAGIYGELCLRGLESWGIEVYAFADRRTDLTEYYGIKVINPEEICKINNVVVLLASVNYLKQIINFLREQKIENYYGISLILKAKIDDACLSDYAKGARKDPEEYQSKINDIQNKMLSIKNIDLVVTQYCNLKCKDCGSLIPCYKHPQHFSSEQVILAFDKFLNYVDYIKELRVLGGETFLYPELTEITDYYSQNPKIKRVIIYTNGVMNPSENIMKQFQDKSVLIRISNYGELSKNINKVVEMCKLYGIEYEILDSMIWRDMGGVGRRNYSKEQAINIFEKCENAKCPSFCNGKLYICPRAAHGEQLGFYKNADDEVIDFAESKLNDDKLKEKLEEFLYGRNHFEACYYCNGNNRWENPIPAAVQITKE